ncbi:MAG: CHAP domain-containing protein [Candidatus Saccharimonadales bacterium]
MSNLKRISLKNIVFALAILVLWVGFSPRVSEAQTMNEIQSEINRLSREINQSEARIGQLRDREDTLQNKLEVLNAEAAQLEAEINRTEREIKQTKSDIKQKESELQRTKELIQANIKVLYKQGNPSTLEMLFSSENFTDFINRQEYLDKVKQSLNEAARESVLIKQALEEKEVELQFKSGELDGQRRQLANRQAEQRRLIEQTRGEESRYQELVAKQRQRLGEAEAQQAAIIAAARAGNSGNITPGTVGNGGYPVEWAPPVPMNSRVDNWGYYSRQCTSYAAWERYAIGRPLPNWGFQGIAHARFWTNSGTFTDPETGQSFYVQGRYAQRDGYTVNNTPAPGAVAVLNSGNYGHVAIVEEVYGGGASFRVSEYNADFNGYFADYNIYNNSNDWSFIHD